ncbi:MAG: hypothetical protein ACYCZF_07445 [Anaerolineae bacterium]
MLENTVRDGSDLVTWSGRIPRHKIQRLYELDAQGITDEELIDDVAYGFYVRCLSILQATRAYAGVVVCPKCGNEIEHQCQRQEPLACKRCGWHTLLAAYARTFLGKHLHGGSAMEVWTQYVDRFPAASNPRDKMMLVDWLIHEVHQSTRSVAVQLIGGSPREVLALLDHLACGDCSSPGLADNQATWRIRMEAGAYRGSMPAREDTVDVATPPETRP